MLYHFEASCRVIRHVVVPLLHVDQAARLFQSHTKTFDFGLFYVGLLFKSRILAAHTLGFYAADDFLVSHLLFGHFLDVSNKLLK